MKTFTSNPLERMMMQTPQASKGPTPRPTAPEGHFCYGCGNYGLGCIRPCYRDIKQKRRPQTEL